MTDKQPRFITKGEIEALNAKLATVPELVEELAVYMTGEPRRGASNESARPAPKSRPPVPVDRYTIAAPLMTALHDAVDAILAAHSLDEPSRLPIPMAAWLRRHRSALQTMPAGVRLADHLLTTIERLSARLLPGDDYYVDPQMVEQANRQIVTAGQAERIARSLGEHGKGLNRRRIDALRRRGKLAATRTSDAGEWLYRLGDVLDAHRKARKARHTEGA